jgi:hypothetical protein
VLLQLVCRWNIYKILRDRDIRFALLLDFSLVQVFLRGSVHAVESALLCLVISIIRVDIFLRRGATILKLLVQMHPIFLIAESLVVKPVELWLRRWSVGSVLMLRLREIEIVILAELLSILRERGVVCRITVLLHVCSQSC